MKDKIAIGSNARYEATKLCELQAGLIKCTHFLSNDGMFLRTNVTALSVS